MRVWVVSEAKSGTLTQCLGVAQHLDAKPTRIIVRRPLQFWNKGLLSRHRSRVRSSAPPDVIISCGGVAISHVRELVSLCRQRPLTVHLATPRGAADLFDLVFVSRHDWDPAWENDGRFHKMLGVPHQITAELLDELRPRARQRWTKEEERTITVLAGGPNRAYLYDDATVDGLIEAVEGLSVSGFKVLVSTSRRSRPDLLERLLKMRSERIVVWDRTGENPFREFLAAADAFLVTKDSITMTCEAVTTGRPTYSFDLAKNLGPRLDKFEWFHRDMSETLKLTRPFRGEVADYQYRPVDEAARVAQIVRDTLLARRPEFAAGASASGARPNPAQERLLLRSQPLPHFAKTLEFHRKWLGAHRLLGRPWFILGAAPEPSLPESLPTDAVHAYVRFAGRSARMHGLPPGDITLLPRWKDAQRAAALDLKAILRLRPALTLRGRMRRLLGLWDADESEIDTPERDDYIIKTLGSLFPDVEKRPSNGIALICFALAHDIPQVVISGISFEAAGHEYERSKLPRRHILEDRAALRRMGELYPGVSTTEASLHRATGIPLYKPS